MRKPIIYSAAALIAGLIISPYIGMAIGSTRSLILGLAPDEAVLQLADKIDSDRAGIEQKTNDLQAMIDSQNSQIAEQQKIIDDQKAELATQKGETSQTKSEISTANASLSNEQNCRKANELYVDIPKKPKKACSVMGPNNIVDMYKEINKAYKNAKGSDEKDSNGTPAVECFKEYLNVLEPAYNDYLKAKELCK